MVNAFEEVENCFKGPLLLLLGIEDIDTTYKTLGVGTSVMLDLRKVGSGVTSNVPLGIRQNLVGMP